MRKGRPACLRGGGIPLRKPLVEQRLQLCLGVFRYNYPFLGVLGVFRQDEKGQHNEQFR